jgi:hypothetical protein
VIAATPKARRIRVDEREYNGGVKRLLLPLTIAALVGLLWGGVTPVHACYFRADFHPAAHSEVILAGRITSWKPAPKLASGTADRRVQPVPVKIRIEVDDTFKGTAAPEVEVVSLGAVDLVDGELRGTGEFPIAGSSAARANRRSASMC